MKTSDKKSGYGIAAALPFITAACVGAGALGGGIFIWGAMSATMAIGPLVSLTGAGVLFGAVLGNAALSIATDAYRILGSLKKRLSGGNSAAEEKESSALSASPEAACTFKADKVTPAFDSASLKAAAPKDAPAAPQPKIPGPKI